MATNPNTQDSTLDPEDIARFNAQAEKWWDLSGPFKPLHNFNPIRLTYLKQQICAQFQRDAAAAQPLKGLRILDVGCGGGLLCEPLARMGASVVGVDAGEKNIGAAVVHKEDLDITYYCTTIENFKICHPEQNHPVIAAPNVCKGSALATNAQADGADPSAQTRSAPLAQDDNAVFDVVLAMEIVEHVADVPLFIAECAKRVKPGGLLFMATLNRTAKSLLFAKIGAEYVLRLLPAGTHDWRQFQKPEELKQYFSNNQLSEIATQGFHYQPFTQKWTFSDDLSVNYAIKGVKC